MGRVDFDLAGTLLIAAAATPYVVVILHQLLLLKRLVAALPESTRAKLPRHPRDPRLAVFGSTRFFLALFRYALRKQPDDTAEIARLKAQSRASAIGELIFGVVFVATIVALWRHGWRPIWPRFGR